MVENYKYIIGIDEAGRGPLAGPVSVGLVLIPADFDWALLPGVNDSKKLSEKKREQMYGEAMKLAARGALFCTVEMMSAKAIDARGIAVVIREAIDKGLQSFAISSKSRLECNSPRGTLGLGGANLSSGRKVSKDFHEIFWEKAIVKLDGSLRAPEYCIHQETIIKGDAKEKVIGLASILAKVTRDRYMYKLAEKPTYAPYRFDRHKGYGTAVHRRFIVEHGLSPEHRKSFCKNITK